MPQICWIRNTRTWTDWSVSVRQECGLLLSSEGEGRGCYPLDGHILCKGCSARRIQDLSAKISTDCWQTRCDCAIFFLKPLPLSQIHEQLHINDSTDKKRSSFVQSYFFLFFFFPPTCLLWVLINFAMGPSGGIKQQFHFFFCYFDEATTSFHPEVLLHFPSFLVHMFSSVINSGLTCRQLGLHLPFIHTGTAQQLACTLSLSLSKTMNVWKDIIDLDLRSGRWCFFRREVA